MSRASLQVGDRVQLTEGVYGRIARLPEYHYIDQKYVIQLETTTRLVSRRGDEFKFIAHKEDLKERQNKAHLLLDWLNS